MYELRGSWFRWRREWMAFAARLIVLALALGTSGHARAQPGEGALVAEVAESLMGLRAPMLEPLGERGWELQTRPEDVLEMSATMRRLPWRTEGGVARAPVSPEKLPSLLSDPDVHVVARAEVLRKIGREPDLIFAGKVENADAASRLVARNKPIFTHEIASYRLLRAAKPPKPVLLQRTPRLPKLGDLERPLRIMVEAEPPTTEQEFFDVYGTKHHMGQLEQMRAAKMALARFRLKVPEAPANPKGVDAPKPETSADRIRRLVGDGNRDSILFVVAHNENGVLRFPDRSTLLISELAAYPNGSLVAVISCNSLRALPTASGHLISTEGIITWSKALETLEAIVPRGQERVRTSLAKILHNAGKVTTALVATAGVAVLVIDHDAETNG